MHHLVVGREQEQSRRVRRPGVGHAVQRRRDAQGEGASDQPQVPPAELPQDDLAQRRRVLQDDPGHGPTGGDVQGGGRAEAGAVNDDGPVAGGGFEGVVGGQRGGADAVQARRAGAAAVAGVVDAPDFHGATSPLRRLDADVGVGPVGVAVEAQDVGVGTLAGRGDPGMAGPDFQLAVVKGGRPPRRPDGTEVARGRVQDQTIRGKEAAHGDQSQRQQSPGSDPARGKKAIRHELEGVEACGSADPALSFLIMRAKFVDIYPEFFAWRTGFSPSGDVLVGNEG